MSIIGSVGTVTITGTTRGRIASLKALLQRPLQWVICLLHCNKLPLQHIFKALDGATKSPDSFAGFIEIHLNGTVLNWEALTLNLFTIRTSLLCLVVSLMN